MNIVIVEDENSIRNGLARIIPRLNADYRVTGMAANGREGLDLIVKTMPDLVIMDIQMPEMDGLDMLTELRGKGITCRVVVLTAYSDFTYAKRAIALNIDNYLLKPIKMPELLETLHIIQESLEQEKGKVMLQERLLSLEQIFRGSILAELPVDEELNQLAKSQYGLEAKETLAVFTVWLGKRFDDRSEQTARLLEAYRTGMTECECMILPSVRFRLVAVIFYHMKDPAKTGRWYGSTVVPAMCRALKPAPVFNWITCEGLAGLRDAFAELDQDRIWNLGYPEGTLITPEGIESIEPVPVKYPFDIEEKMKKSVTVQNREDFLEALCQFRQMSTCSLYHPDEIRETCVRFCVSILSLAKTIGKVKESVSTRTMVGEISQAVTWEEIQAVFENLYQSVAVDEEEDNISMLVKRAKKMIEESYSQGITLEELAQKLHVSDEYLSTQFKKETGMSFTETVRKYRIDRIKELLLHSGLKLNQIADMVGYSDPKYMSKVFKEEVGMLPAEFRKANL